MIMESLTAELDEAKAALSQRDKEVVELKSIKVESEKREADQKERLEEIARLTKENGDLELRLKLAEQEKNNAASQGGDEMTKV